MAVAVSAPPTTIEQYLGFESPEGYCDELIRGRMVLFPEPKLLHNEIAERICALLRAALDESLMVGQRVNFRFPNASSMPNPDIFVVKTEDWISIREADEYPEGSEGFAVCGSGLTGKSNFLPFSSRLSCIRSMALNAGLYTRKSKKWVFIDAVIPKFIRRAVLTCRRTSLARPLGLRKFSDFAGRA